MRPLIRLLVLAVVCSGAQTWAQQGAGASPSKGWQWWLLSKSRSPQSSLLIHPNARDIGIRDRAREGAKQRAEDRRFFERIKYERLLFYRTAREQAVSASIARKAAEGPFRPTRKTSSPGPEVAMGPGAGAAHENARAPAPTGSNTTPADPPTPDPAADTPLDAIDKVVDRAVEQLIGKPATAPTRSALFVALIVAMFIVPSVAITMLMLAVSHLRARLWGRAFIFAALGVFVGWGAVSAARQIAPEAPSLSLTPAWLQNFTQ